jgi:hypothetical protein
VIILPPARTGLERAASGPVGGSAFGRIPAVQRSAPPREDGRARQSRPSRGDSERSRERDNREVRQLVVRSGSGDLPQNFGGAGFASTNFLVQMLGQGSGAPAGPLAHHRDGAALSSEAYRRAGAEPPRYSEQPALFRIAV